MITKQQALTEDEFHERLNGQRCLRWRRNGKTQVWKKDPSRFKLPIKRGLYAYDAITESFNPSFFHTAKDCPYGEKL